MHLLNQRILPGARRALACARAPARRLRRARAHPAGRRLAAGRRHDALRRHHDAHHGQQPRKVLRLRAGAGAHDERSTVHGSTVHAQEGVWP